MSTFETYYCNLTTDLDNIVDLQGFDSKKLITNWQTHSSNLYRAESGYVSMLFKEGKELGAAQSGTGDLNVNDEWTFVAADNLVYYYKQDTHFSEGKQFTIKWNDPDWNFWWPIKNPILSRRDELGGYVDA